MYKCQIIKLHSQNIHKSYIYSQKNPLVMQDQQKIRNVAFKNLHSHTTNIAMKILQSERKT